MDSFENLLLDKRGQVKEKEEGGLRQGGTLQPGRWGVGGVVGHVQQVCLRASAVRPSNTSLHSSLTLGDVSPTLAKALSAAASSCAHCDNTQLVNLGNDCVLPCAFPAALGGRGRRRLQLAAINKHYLDAPITL